MQSNVGKERKAGGKGDQTTETCVFLSFPRCVEAKGKGGLRGRLSHHVQYLNTPSFVGVSPNTPHTEHTRDETFPWNERGPMDRLVPSSFAPVPPSFTLEMKTARIFSKET